LIFLDTDILSYYLDGKPFTYDRINKELVSGHEISLTNISVYEIIKGLRKTTGEKNAVLTRCYHA